MMDPITIAEDLERPTHRFNRSEPVAKDLAIMFVTFLIKHGFGQHFCWTDLRRQETSSDGVVYLHQVAQGLPNVDIVVDETVSHLNCGEDHGRCQVTLIKRNARAVAKDLIEANTPEHLVVRAAA